MRCSKRVIKVSCLSLRLLIVFKSSTISDSVVLGLVFFVSFGIELHLFTIGKMLMKGKES